MRDEENEWKRKLFVVKKTDYIEWYDPSWLPDGVGDYCKDLSLALDVPIPAVANTFIAAMHIACGCFTRVQINPKWYEPIIFWGMIVAPPGMKKSPIMNNVGSLFMDCTETVESNFMLAISKYQEDMREYNKRLKKWEREESLSINKPEKPQQPKPDTVIVSDFTMEGITRWMPHSPRLSAWQDELSNLFANLNRYTKNGDNAPFLIKCFQGQPHSIIRAGATDMAAFNPIRIPQSHLNIFGTIQPEVFGDSFSGLIKNGIAARFSAFSTFIPKGVTSKAQVRAVNVVNESTMVSIFQRLYQIKPHHTLKVDQHGVELVAAYKDSIADNLSVDIMGSLNKSETWIYRLAGVKALWDFAARGGDPNQCGVVSLGDCEWAVQYFKNVCMRNIHDFWVGAAYSPDHFERRLDALKRQILSLGKMELSINDLRKAKVTGMLSSETRAKYTGALEDDGFWVKLNNGKYLITVS